MNIQFVAIDYETGFQFPTLRENHSEAIVNYMKGTPSDRYLQYVDVLPKYQNGPGFIYHGENGKTIVAKRNGTYIIPALYRVGGVQASLAGYEMPPDFVNAVMEKAQNNDGVIGIAKKLEGRHGGGLKGADGYAIFTLESRPGIQVKVHVNYLENGNELPRISECDQHYFYLEGAVREGTELKLKKLV